MTTFNRLMILCKFSEAISDLHFRHNIAGFCSILPTKIVQTKDHSTVLRLWAMDGVYSLLNKWFSDSLINTVKCFVSEWISRLNESVEYQWLSYVGMKDSKYQVKCFLTIPKNTKWKKELKLNTILLLKRWNFFIYIYLLLFHFAFTCTFTFNT